MHSYVAKMYTKSEIQNSGQLLETNRCIKGVDYEGRPTWNEYSFIQDIGEGAFAKVILAQKNHNFTKYAIKQLKKSKLSKNARSELDQFREIDVQKQLDHPNVVRLYEIIDDEDDEKIHMIMEYCQYGDIMRLNESDLTFTPPSVLLSHLPPVELEQMDEGLKPVSLGIKNRYLTEQQIQAYSFQILDAVDYMHQKGYLHLDIKPQNILIDENLDIKLSDFGSTWLFYGENDQISEAKGTSYFLAPESIFSPSAAQKYNNYNYFSGRLYDVWTIGLTIYVLVFNSLPYKPDSKGMSDITKAILNFELDFDNKQLNDNSSDGDESQASQSNNNNQPAKRQISEGLKFFLCKMLEKDPSKRASVAQLKKDTWLNSKIY